MSLSCVLISVALLSLLAATANSETADVQADEKAKYTIQLDGACKNDHECAAAFSACKAGKCVCGDGTKKSGPVCIPEVRQCPSGEPLVDANKRLLICNPNQYDISQLIYTPTAYSADESVVEAPQNGTCPTNFVCIQEGEVSYGSVRGFCCPVPERCPTGKPDLNRTCSYQESNLDFCPYDTHYCFRSIRADVGGDICCPRPCPDGSIHRNGTCFRPSSIGEPCESDLQCFASSAECKNGKCVCPKEMVISSKYGTCTRPYCPYTNETLDPLKTASGDFMICPTTKCPANSYCVYGDNVCCPKPAPACTSNEVLASKDIQLCTVDIFAEGPKQCPGGTYCRSLYDEANPNATTFKESGSLPEVNHGVCCKE